jgi:hypothetical protein
MQDYEDDDLQKVRDAVTKVHTFRAKKQPRGSCLQQGGCGQRLDAGPRGEKSKYT